LSNWRVSPNTSALRPGQFGQLKHFFPRTVSTRSLKVPS